MKLLVEVSLSLFLHPVAMLLMWLDLARRGDLTGFQKFVWAVTSLLWGVGPILYLLVGDGKLW